MRQEQFLEVIDRDEAERRFHAALDLGPLPAEEVPLERCLGRTLAEDVFAPVDVPAFDRSNMDGYALRAEDTFGASEQAPRRLRLNRELIASGVVPRIQVARGTATAIATGAVIPRGADAVLLVEATDEEGDELVVRRAVTPGEALTFAGSDIARGELVLHDGEALTARETGVLAAIGRERARVRRRPRVAILSTGDEVVPPGARLAIGQVFDSNARALADAVTELGGEPHLLGIIPDDEGALERALAGALGHDVVLVSGGTSKGPGDVACRVISRLPPPGIVVHGVALKPGKPLCLAVCGKTPLVVLPGFPTSALFTFHEFVAPLLRRMLGQVEERRGRVRATLPLRVNSERGRTEYLLVHLVPADEGLRAYPLGKGSGSVTTWSRADGFVTIPQNTEFVAAGAEVTVTLLSRDIEAKDLVFIGSHCVGLDVLVAALRRRGYTARIISVGSEAGLRAAKAGECDVAGVHLLDPATGRYNEPFLDESVVLLRGYGRMQGVVHRLDDARFAGLDCAGFARALPAMHGVVMVNRNRGSGTRLLIDRLLGELRPTGHTNEARTHNAVAAAVAAGRADFGVAIATVARDYGLGFLPLAEERYDFVVPRARRERPALRAFAGLLEDAETRALLRARGFLLGEWDGAGDAR
ncbi:MAG: molybdopterin biosynthesis protein [Planctomycetes bacterium]|nr:molybdopterin biosynthesis protein [Planctomycetota bacterium]